MRQYIAGPLPSRRGRRQHWAVPYTLDPEAPNTRAPGTDLRSGWECSCRCGGFGFRDESAAGRAAGLHMRLSVR